MIGNIAATAPFMPINPLKTAATIIMATICHVSFPPVLRIRS
jgi:hypothetical protein